MQSEFEVIGFFIERHGGIEIIIVCRQAQKIIYVKIGLQVY